MKSGWKKYLLYSILIIIGGSLLFGLIRLGYSAEWTGFGEYTQASPNAERGKTLWDWMELLIIPLFLAGGVFYLNWSERKTEREIAKDRQQEAALQAYFDQITELVLEKKLLTTKNKAVIKIARNRTLTVLRGLDAQRKKLVIIFLRELGLIIGEDPTISLHGADLRYTNFYEGFLAKVNLEGTDLRNAKLNGAFWAGALLNGVDLRNTDLRRAILEAIDLAEADLERADLRGADLTNSNLVNASLFKAKVSGEQLAKAYSLQGAIMPDGTKYE